MFLKKTKKSKEEIKKNKDGKIKQFFYAINPKNVSKDLKAYGFEKSIIQVLLVYLVVFFLLTVIHFAFDMDFFPYTLTMFVLSSLMIPNIIRYTYKRAYEDRKFSEVNQYIERTMYNFKSSNKIITSLQMTAESFPEGEVKNTIIAAAKMVLSDGKEAALLYLEKKYNSSYVRKMHSLLLRAEDSGSEFEDMLEVQLESRRSWEKRTKDFQKEKDRKRNFVVGGIVISTVVVTFMERILVYALPNQTGIAKLGIVESATVLFVVLNLLLYMFVCKKLSDSLLEPTKNLSDEKVKEYYQYVHNYNAVKEYKKAVKHLLVPVFIAIALYEMKMSSTMYTIPVVFAVITLAKPALSYRQRRKAIVKEINVAFPRWLSDVAMLKGSNSIRVAIAKSYENAPIVLQPELVKMINAQAEDPLSSAPYFNFLREYNISFVTSAMQMLEAIASGKGGDTKAQTRELLEFNASILDEEERLANEDHLALFLVLGWLPSGTASMKMIVDMVTFLVVFMGTFTNMSI